MLGRITMNTLKKYYLTICIVLLGIGVFIQYLATLQDIQYQQVQRIIDGEIKIDNIYKLSDTYPILVNVSNALITFSISLFISLFIIRKIEEEQRESINEDIFNAILKKSIPDEIFKLVTTDLWGKQLIRKNAKWIYTFEEKDDMIVLRQTLKSELHNIGNEDLTEKYPSVILNDKNAETRIEKFVLKDRNGQEIQDLHVKDETQKPTDFTIPCEEFVTVEIVYKTKYRGIVRDAYFTEHSLINIQLIVNHPEGYKFDLLQCFSNKLVTTFTNEKQKMYELHGEVLPRQGMFFHLEKSG